MKLVNLTGGLAGSDFLTQGCLDVLFSGMATNRLGKTQLVPAEPIEVEYLKYPESQIRVNGPQALLSQRERLSALTVRFA